MCGGANEAAMDYSESTSDPAATYNLSVSGRDGTCSVSLHGEINSYTATGGSVMSEYGSCSAGGQPFTYISSPIQLPSLPRGPPPLLSIPDVSFTHIQRSPIAAAIFLSTPAARANSMNLTTTAVA